MRFLAGPGLGGREVLLNEGDRAETIGRLRSSFKSPSNGRGVGEAESTRRGWLSKVEFLHLRLKSTMLPLSLDRVAIPHFCGMENPEKLRKDFVAYFIGFWTSILGKVLAGTKF